jgi:hypothetical protein
MGRYDDDDDDSDWEQDYESDSPDDPEQEPTIDCPHCGNEIHEESQRCPKCGEYLSVEDSPRSPPPAWIVIGVLVCLALTLSWVFSVWR